MRISVLSRPLFNSFCGVMDIKQGAMLVVLFGLLNKVAGVYGLVGSLSAGGSIGQISYFVYCTASLAAFVIGLKAVSEEQTTRLLQFSHYYTADHLLNTFYTLLFAHSWWTGPHDGVRVSNSKAQDAMVALAKSRGEIGGQELTPEQFKTLAMVLWSKEKMVAVLVLVVCWAVKVYFALLLYSFCSHLRLNTYRALPLTNLPGSAGSVPNTPHAGAPSSRRGSKMAMLPKNAEGEAEEEFNWDSEDEESGRGRTGARGEQVV